jgi:Alpha-kinase family
MGKMEKDSITRNLRIDNIEFAEGTFNSVYLCLDEDNVRLVVKKLKDEHPQPDAYADKELRKNALCHSISREYNRRLKEKKVS